MSSALSSQQMHFASFEALQFHHIAIVQESWTSTRNKRIQETSHNESLVKTLCSCSPDQDLYLLLKST